MNKPVYSTEFGSQKKQPKKSSSKYKTADGPTKVRLESKGRGGKKVSVLFNLPFSEEDAKNLLKELKLMCGCGGSIKGSTIELQGDVRSRVEDYFKLKEWKITRAGS